MAEKFLLLSYYWPPSGGSGVQRWTYFSHYLPESGIIPLVITVDEKKASYRFTDASLVEKVSHIPVVKTKTLEPLKLYSRLASGSENEAIPIGLTSQGKLSLFEKMSRFVRGNFFIPDARIGWNRFAYREAQKQIQQQQIKLIITTGPPNSTHLIGLKLKQKFDINWIADFRDPWVELHYNSLLYRLPAAKRKDARLEKRVLQMADHILTIGPSMKQHLAERGGITPEKISVIFNGYDKELFDSVAAEPNPNAFTISHIGILSDTQPITPFISALEKIKLSGHPVSDKLQLNLVGKVSPSILQEIAEKLPWLKVSFEGYLPQKQAIARMKSSDLLFNSLAEMNNSRLLISGKLMEYIAAAKPILVLGNSQGDAASLLKHLPFCKVLERNNVVEIQQFLTEIFDHWQQNHTFEVSLNEKIYTYSRQATAQQLANILKKYL